jgi:septum formation protein
MDFEIVVSEADESCDASSPARLTEELAQRKALAVKELLRSEGRYDGDTVIIAADTVVAQDGEILGKPSSREDAHRMLSKLSGKSHSVVSGLCLVRGEKTIVSHTETKVFFDEIPEEELAKYLDTDEPYDKAGAYAIQEHGDMIVANHTGELENIIGLPLRRLNEKLHRFLA